MKNKFYEKKKAIVIRNYFNKDCTVDDSIKEAYRKGFERALEITSRKSEKIYFVDYYETFNEGCSNSYRTTRYFFQSKEIAEQIANLKAETFYKTYKIESSPVQEFTDFKDNDYKKIINEFETMNEKCKQDRKNWEEKHGEIKTHIWYGVHSSENKEYGYHMFKTQEEAAQYGIEKGYKNFEIIPEEHEW